MKLLLIILRESILLIIYIIKKIKEKLSPKQLIYFDYMLQEYKPREVATITGDSGNYARKQFKRLD